jgi:hypothetical protein
MGADDDTFTGAGYWAYDRIILDDPEAATPVRDAAAKTRMLAWLQTQIDTVYRNLADDLARDMYGDPGPRVRRYNGGTGTPAWVGRCAVCSAWFVADLYPAAHGRLPDDCRTLRYMATLRREADHCPGVVLLAPDWQARLAAYLLGGYAALRGDP